MKPTITDSASAVALPVIVDHLKKIDYYRNRSDLTACFNAGLLNNDHLHACIDTKKVWKLDPSGRGFTETTIPVQKNDEIYVWPFAAPPCSPVDEGQVGSPIPTVKQVRMMIANRPLTLHVSNVNEDGTKGYTVLVYTFKNEAAYNEWDRVKPAGWIAQPAYFRITETRQVNGYFPSIGFLEGVGTHNRNIFPGARLFQLKATYGIPLEISLENLTRRSMVVDWQGFIKEARLAGWYDFQTMEVVQNALADVFDRDVQQAILQRMKKFILANPMPA